MPVKWGPGFTPVRQIGNLNSPADKPSVLTVILGRVMVEKNIRKVRTRMLKRHFFQLIPVFVLFMGCLAPRYTYIPPSPRSKLF